jgi:hypothetical protein
VDVGAGAGAGLDVAAATGAAHDVAGLALRPKTKARVSRIKSIQHDIIISPHRILPLQIGFKIS